MLAFSANRKKAVRRIYSCLTEPLEISALYVGNSGKYTQHLQCERLSCINYKIGMRRYGDISIQYRYVGPSAIRP